MSSSHIYRMVINDDTLNYLKLGKIKYIGHLYHPLLYPLKVGDIIQFIDNEGIISVELQVSIKKLLYYSTFRYALNDIGVESVFPINNLSLDDACKIYTKYISYSSQIRYGVVMIEVEVINI